MENFANNLKLLRKDNNYNIRQLADKIGVDKSSISFWENGINEPKASYLIKLAETFNVSVDYLLGLETDYGVKVYDNNVINCSKNLLNNNQKEQKLLDIYNNLSEINQNRWLAYGEGMLLGENKAILNENLKIEITNKRKN